MILNKLLYRILPDSIFLKIRYLYYKYQGRMYKPLTEEMFRDVLINKLGVMKGKVVFVHSSLGFLNIDFPPFKVLGILIDLVGPEGTLIFPAWHFNYRAEDYLKKGLIFDVKRSPTVMGLLPELARRHPLAIRSNHPTNSIVAIGKNAKEIIEDHEKSIYPCGEMSPYYKMIKFNAIIIGLGVSSHFVSFVHCPEDVLKDKFPLQTRTDEVFSGKVKLSNGEIITVDTLAAHSNIGKRNIPKYFKKYISRSIFTPYKIKGNNFYRADSVALYARIVELAKSGITIYNC